MRSSIGYVGRMIAGIEKLIPTFMRPFLFSRNGVIKICRYSGLGAVAFA